MQQTVGTGFHGYTDEECCPVGAQTGFIACPPRRIVCMPQCCVALRPSDDLLRYCRGMAQSKARPSIRAISIVADRMITQDSTKTSANKTNSQMPRRSEMRITK